MVNEVSYSETDIKEGLLSMLNKGKIPRGTNIKEIFMGREQNLMVSRAAKYIYFFFIKNKIIIIIIIIINIFICRINKF